MESVEMCGLSSLPELPTVREWAAAMGVSQATVYRQVEEGQVKSIRVRNAIRICRDMTFEQMGIQVDRKKVN